MACFSQFDFSKMEVSLSPSLKYCFSVCDLFVTPFVRWPVVCSPGIFIFILVYSCSSG